METLNAENIFTDEEVGRILGDIEASDTGEDQEQEQETQEEEEVVEDLEDEFSPNKEPESVGNQPPAQQSGSPTPTNLFHSIAAALREEGVFPDTSDEELDSVVDAGTFRSLINKQIEAGLDDRQKRISAALSYGVEPTEIQQYEGALEFLNQISEEALSARNEQGEELRKRLIYQDLMNRGYSQEKAIREIKKSLDAGTDIDDARDAFAANKEFFQGRYDAIVNNARQQQQHAQQQYSARAEQFRKTLLEDSKVFGDVTIDKDTRKRVLDILTKPTKKDDSGRFYTELQWAQREDPDKFSRNIGLLYVLTDGFKNVEKLVGPQVKERTRKGLAELENVINSTQRNPDGSLRLMNGTNTDPESFFDSDWELDI